MEREPMPGWLRATYGAPNRLYAAGLGRLLGHRFVQIRHVGRRSGRPFSAVVEVVRYDPATGEATVMAGYGPSADWYRNVLAAGRVDLDFGRGPRPAGFRTVGQAEAEQVLRDYLRRYRLVALAMNAFLGWLAGWPFDASAAAITKLCQEMPMLAFRPEAV
jgi:deazaflavin-dependent oxidoreductase (nitroreductase family)